MTGIAFGLVRTNQTDWRRRCSVKCRPSSAPLAAEPHVVNTRLTHVTADGMPATIFIHGDADKRLDRWIDPVSLEKPPAWRGPVRRRALPPSEPHCSGSRSL